MKRKRINKFNNKFKYFAKFSKSNPYFFHNKIIHLSNAIVKSISLLTVNKNTSSNSLLIINNNNLLYGCLANSEAISFRDFSIIQNYYNLHSINVRTLVAQFHSPSTTSFVYNEKCCLNVQAIRTSNVYLRTLCNWHVYSDQKWQNQPSNKRNGKLSFVNRLVRVCAHWTGMVFGVRNKIYHFCLCFHSVSEFYPCTFHMFFSFTFIHKLYSLQSRYHSRQQNEKIAMAWDAQWLGTRTRTSGTSDKHEIIYVEVCCSVTSSYNKHNCTALSVNLTLTHGSSTYTRKMSAQTPPIE